MDTLDDQRAETEVQLLNHESEKCNCSLKNLVTDERGGEDEDAVRVHPATLREEEIQAPLARPQEGGVPQTNTATTLAVQDTMNQPEGHPPMVQGPDTRYQGKNILLLDPLL